MGQKCSSCFKRQNQREQNAADCIQSAQDLNHRQMQEIILKKNDSNVLVEQIKTSNIKDSRKPVIRSESKESQVLKSEIKPNRVEQKKQQSNQIKKTIKDIERQNPQLFKKLQNKKLSQLTDQEKYILKQYETKAVNIGIEKMKQKKYLQALNIFETYIQLAKIIYQKPEKQSMTFTVKRYIADIYFIHKKYANSVEGYQFCQKNKSQMDLLSEQERQALFDKLASSYYETKQYENADKIYQKLLIAEDNKRKKDKKEKPTLKYAKILNKRGLVQIRSEKYVQARKTNLECLKIKRQCLQIQKGGNDSKEGSQNEPIQYVINYGNIANTYYLQNKYQACIEECQKCLKICKKYKDVKGVEYTNALYCKGNACFQLKKYPQAKACFEQSGNNFYLMKNQVYIQILYKVMKCCRQMNDIKQYNYYTNKLIQLMAS